MKCVIMAQKLDGGLTVYPGGLTVYPEVGVYMSVNELTGLCHVSCDLETTGSDVSEVFTYLLLHC